MYIKSFLLLIVLIFFNACGTFSSGAKSDASTNWVINPPADNAKYFYAVGYGETKKDAKSDALSVISAKISVDVSSNFSSSVTAMRQGSDEKVLRETKVDVVSKSKDIQYTDVKILKSAKAYLWMVLVEVDRDILISIYKRKLDKIDDKIKQEWQLFLDADLFEKLKLSVNINRYLKQTDSFFPLLHALDKNYDDSAYRVRYLKYTKEMREAQKKLVFKIVWDENSKNLASLIKAKLSAQNAKFSNNKYNVLIDITTKVKKRKYRSTNYEFANLIFALRLTTIKALNKNGDEVSSVVYKTKEGSDKGFEDAISKTAKHEKKINEIGIIEFITGN